MHINIRVKKVYNKRAIKLIRHSMLRDEHPLEYYIFNEKFHKQLDKDDPKIKEFEKIAKKNPKDYNVYLDWARHIWCGSRLHEVIEKIKYSIELNPDNVESYISLGNALCQQGNTEEAEKAYMKALELNPNSQETYISWAGCLRSHNKSEKALEKYKQAEELNPKSSSLYFQWGLCLSLYMNEYQEASKKFEKCIKLTPPNYERLDLVYIELGKCLYHMGKTDEAIDKYIKAIEIFPWNSRSYSGWSDCLRDQGEIEDSIELNKSFRKIYEIRAKYRKEIKNKISTDNLTI